MRIRALTPRLEAYLNKHEIRQAYEKQADFFETNPRHPSLRTELLQPRHLGIYSFRVTKNYRAVFVYCGDRTIEIIDINNHYN